MNDFYIRFICAQKESNYSTSNAALGVYVILRQVLYRIVFFNRIKVRAAQVHSVAQIKSELKLRWRRKKTLEAVFELAVCVRLITKS